MTVGHGLDVFGYVFEHIRLVVTLYEIEFSIVQPLEVTCICSKVTEMIHDVGHPYSLVPV